MVINIMNLKCRLIFEWDMGNMIPVMEDYYKEGYTKEEAKKQYENWIKEDMLGKVFWVADNSLPEDYNYYLEMKWKEK